MGVMLHAWSTSSLQQTAQTRLLISCGVAEWALLSWLPKCGVRLFAFFSFVRRLQGLGIRAWQATFLLWLWATLHCGGYVRGERATRSCCCLGRPW